MTSALSDQHHQLLRRSGWPLERVLFPVAGSVTLLAAALSAFVSPWFLMLNALVGVNQWLYSLFGACPSSLVLERVFKLPSVIFPERRPVATPNSRASSRRAPSSLPPASSLRPRESTAAPKP